MGITNKQIICRNHLPWFCQIVKKLKDASPDSSLAHHHELFKFISQSSAIHPIQGHAVRFSQYRAAKQKIYIDARLQQHYETKI